MDLLSLTDINRSNSRCCGSVSLEVLNGLHFAVGGNGGDEVLLGYVINSDGNIALAAGYEGCEHDYRQDGDNDAAPNVLAVTVALSS